MWALCVVAAAGAVLADAGSTGVGVVDGALRAGFAVAVTWAAARARPGAWLLAAGIVLVAAHASGPAFAAAFVLFAVAVAGNLMRRPGPAIGALVGAGTSVTVLHLTSWGPTGATALCAAAAAATLVVSGLRGCPAPLRRRILTASAVVGGIVLVLVVLFTGSALLARSHAEAGADAARAGVEAARDGRTRRAIAHFEEAQRELDRAASFLEKPWSRAAGVVPLVGPQERALRRMVTNAAGLADVGATTAREANVGKIRAVDGRIDPAALAALEAPLTRVHTSLVETGNQLAELDPTWLLPVLRNGLDDLRESVAEATRDADTALLASRTGPALLGADGPKQYFVMFTTPTETRAGGGFLGNWGILTAEDGRLTLSDFGRNSDLNEGGDPEQRVLTGLDEYVGRYGAFEPTREWRNINLTPDFPTVADVVGQLYPQSGGAPVDGVLALDPRALARLLRLTGPVDVAGLDEPLSADNASRVLLRDQYLEFPVFDDRTDFLAEAARVVTDRLTTTSLPGPRDVGTTLAPAVAGKHLLFTAFDPEGGRLLDRLGVSGRFGPFPADALALVTQNAGGNKIDLFLHRSLEVRTVVDPGTGRQRSRVTIRLRNDAPADGLPTYVIGNAAGLPPGTNKMLLSLYTPLALQSATLDGAPLTLSGGAELGLNVYTQYVEVGPGATVTIEVDLEGGARLGTGDGSPRYRLDLWQQPMVNPDQVKVVMEADGGWSATEPARGFTVDDGTASFRGTLRHDETLSATLAR